MLYLKKTFINKKDLFCNKVEKFHLFMCKQILAINKNVSNMKFPTKVGRVPFEINTEVQLVKYLQQFLFLNGRHIFIQSFLDPSRTYK